MAARGPAGAARGGRLLVGFLVAFGLAATTAGSAARAAFPSTQLLIEHWDGAAWRQASAQPVRGGSSLSAVTALSRTDVWAVGSGVKVPPNGADHWYPLAEHWNGASWQSVVLPAPKETTPGIDLVGVAGSGPGNAWAVGSDAGRTLFEHWNGHSWRLKSSRSSSRFTPSSVAVLSARAAWTVGSYLNAKGKARTRTLRWNGSSWRSVRSPNPSGPGGYDELMAVSGRSARDVWAVGDYKRGSRLHTLVLHWNGLRWRRAACPSPGPRYSSLRSVVAVGRHNVWAVGAYRANKAQRPLAEHWDGRRWRRVPVPSESPTSGFEVLSGVAAVSRRDVWAVGRDLSQGPGEPFAERWDGSSWTVVPTPATPVASLTGIAAVSASDAWAVGEIENP